MNREIKITDKNSLTKKDLELIEYILYKSADDVAVAIGRSFERLEERMDAIESRIYSRLGELEDMLTIIRDNKIT